MAVRPVQCSVCFVIGDMRAMHQCPGCARVVCKSCAVEPPFPKYGCIMKKAVCPGHSRSGDGPPEPHPAPEPPPQVEGLVPMALRKLGLRKRR